jgi:hypothetical protein
MAIFLIFLWGRSGRPGQSQVKDMDYCLTGQFYRAQCSNDAIHAPFVAGISGGPNGAYSVALSGGYDDDVDLGYALYVFQIIRISGSCFAARTLALGVEI